MIETVNIKSSVPVYEQIENHVQFAIATGNLKSGAVLTSIRVLAKQLGADVNTVSRAYKGLVDMGFISTRPGLGYFIKERVQATCQNNCRKRTVEHLHEATQAAKAAGIGKQELNDIISRS